MSTPAAALPIAHDPALPGCADPFDATLRRHGLDLRRRPITTLQVNVGKVCNQACRHCHVEAGPNRTEAMDRPTAERVLALLDGPGGEHVQTLDVTGGAPELNPQFRFLVEGATARGRSVIDRCNLTVLLEPGQEDTAAFLAAHRVRVVASLPCYGPENVDRQRGGGVFEKSIAALKRLNALGYGRGDGLVLDLVYNPLGPSLPPAQAGLEAAYKQRLAEDFGVVFDHLLTLANLPVKRFRQDLERDGRLEGYMDLLCGAFNPATVEGLMCRDLLSIGWDGRLHDCDFNQMLDMPLGEGPATIFEVDDLATLNGAPIATGDHCYGCTAGAGSSCGGALA
jgi:radical SAM/Cys-rich protein